MAIVMTLSPTYTVSTHAATIVDSEYEPPSTISVSLVVDAPSLNAITVGQSLQDQIPKTTPTPVEPSKTVQNKPEQAVITETYDLSSIQQIARHLCDQSFGEGQFQYLANIINAESGWNPTAEEKHTGAYGLGQALPASKMASFGADYRSNPVTQLRWLMAYIQGRYVTPQSAWLFHLIHGWY
jgi:hypothetical protein